MIAFDFYKESVVTFERVHGVDDRILLPDELLSVHPFSSFAKLCITHGGSIHTMGTGFFVSPNVLLTAGHFVYIRKLKSWPSAITVLLAYSDDSKMKSEMFHEKKMFIHPNWALTADSNVDYGILMVDKNYNSFVEMGEPDMANDIALFGYDGDRNRGGRIVGTKGPIDTIAKSTLLYNIDTFGGQSGSCVYDMTQNVAVAIHTSGGSNLNSGVKLDKVLISKIKSIIDKHKIDENLTLIS